MSIFKEVQQLISTSHLRLSMISFHRVSMRAASWWSAQWMMASLHSESSNASANSLYSCNAQQNTASPSELSIAVSIKHAMLPLSLRLVVSQYMTHTGLNHDHCTGDWERLAQAISSETKTRRWNKSQRQHLHDNVYKNMHWRQQLSVADPRLWNSLPVELRQTHIKIRQCRVDGFWRRFCLIDTAEHSDFFCLCAP